jgi:hypothetical protein
MFRKAVSLNPVPDTGVSVAIVNWSVDLELVVQQGHMVLVDAAVGKPSRPSGRGLPGGEVPV